MKSQRKIILLLSLSAAVLLFSLIFINVHSPRFMATDDRLVIEHVDAVLSSHSLYLMDGQWNTTQAPGRKNLTLVLPDACDIGDLALYSPRGLDIQINGVAFINDSSPFSIVNLGSLHADTGFFDIQVSSSVFPGNDLLFIGAEKTAHLYSRITMGIWTVFAGIALAILIQCVSLYRTKRSEKYLILAAIYAYTVFARVMTFAFPELIHNKVLWSLLLGQISTVRPLSDARFDMVGNLLMMGKAVCIMLVHRALFAVFQPKNRRYNIIYLPIALCVLNTGISLIIRNVFVYETMNLMVFGALYICEIFVSLHDDMSREDITLALFCTLTAAVWFFMALCKLSYIPNGFIDHLMNNRSIEFVFTAVGFMIAINTKFAGKYNEADILWLRLTETNAQLEKIVAEKTEDLQASLSELQMTYARKNRLLTDLMHNLKSPLFSIMGYLDILNAQIPPEEKDIHESLRIVERSSERILKQVEELLLLDRLNENRVRYTMLHMNVYAMLKDLEVTIRAQAKEKHITVETFCAPGLAIIADELYLRQVVENVVDNAMRYCPENGKITIAAAEEEQACHIVISNDGPVISDGDIDHLFDRYFSRNLDRHKLSGLGLATAMGIIAGHGGTIWAERGRAVGAAFHIILPVRQNPQLDSD